MACENCDCDKCVAVVKRRQQPDPSRYDNGNWIPVTTPNFEVTCDMGEIPSSKMYATV